MAASDEPFEPVLRALMHTVLGCPECQFALTHVSDHFTKLMKEAIERLPP